MKNKLIKCLQFFVILLSTSLVYSQNVSGKVTDATGPLVGASILVKGTTNGAQTDFDGSYSLKNVGANAVLIFRFIGMETKEVNVDGKSVVNTFLREDQQKLKEVVVIGYGSVKKKDATGAIDQISSKQFDNIAATSPADILRGKVSGVQVTSSSGEPGAGASIRIRGNSSIRSGNGPLIVVDGVPLDGGDVSGGSADVLGTSSARNPLNFVNQNDIESMTILKDASSTAIYGSRGANGVIVITTKKSKSRESQLDYTTSVSFSKFSSKLDVMDSATFVKNGGSDTGSRGYDWKNAVLRDGLTINNDLSLSKSTETSNTRLSFGSSNTEGIVKNTGLDKYTIALNNSNEFFGGGLKIDAKINYAALKDKATLITNNAGFIGNLIGSALYWNPSNPIYDNSSDGYFNPGYSLDSDPTTLGNQTVYGSETYLNPVQLLDSYNDYTNTNKILASIKSTFKFNKNFNYQFLFGVEGSTSIRKSQLLPTIQIQGVARAGVPNSSNTKFGQANIRNDVKFNKTFEHTLNYNGTVSDNFIFDALLGYSYYDYNADGSGSSGIGFDAAQGNLIDNISGGLEREYRAYSYRNKVELQSTFARVNATILKKLLITASVRRDGSSKLGPNNKYDYFPAVGLGYKIVDDKEGILNSLKLRGSYGKTGNQEFAVNSAIGKQTYNYNGALGINNSGNSNLKWETTKSYGVGLDFSLINNRLSGSVDYYNRDTNDLIFPVPAASVQPGPSSNRFVNLPGNLINTGFEVGLNCKIINKENVTWDFSVNSSSNQSKMTNFAGFIQAGALNGQGLTNAYVQVVTNDAPIYSYYLYDFKGYTANGSSIYSDAAGNDGSLGLASKKLVGKQGLPKMNLGFSTNFRYKSFDASVSFYGAFGHYLYNNTANAYFLKSTFLGGRNVPTNIATSSQSQADPNTPSTKFLEKGDFIRMGNLTFGYTLDASFLNRAKIKSARFFVNGQNLLLFTDYSGFDPEVNTDKSLNGVPSAGIDYLSYPRSKSIAFGLNLTF